MKGLEGEKEEIKKGDKRREKGEWSRKRKKEEEGVERTSRGERNRKKGQNNERSEECKDDVNA